MIFSACIQNVAQQSPFFSFKNASSPQNNNIFSLSNNTHIPLSLLPSGPVSLDLPPLSISLKGIIK